MKLSDLAKDVKKKKKKKKDEAVLKKQRREQAAEHELAQVSIVPDRGPNTDLRDPEAGLGHF